MGRWLVGRTLFDRLVQNPYPNVQIRSKADPHDVGNKKGSFPHRNPKRGNHRCQDKQPQDGNYYDSAPLVSPSKEGDGPEGVEGKLNPKQRESKHDARSGQTLLPDEEDGYSHEYIEDGPNWPECPVWWGVAWFLQSGVPGWDRFEREKAADASGGKTGKDTDNKSYDTAQVHNWFLALLLYRVLQQDYNRLNLRQCYGYLAESQVQKSPKTPAPVIHGS